MQAKIEVFLNGLEAAGDARYDTLIRVREMLRLRHPELEERFQYGGILFYDRGEAYCGLFARKDYVTLELANAATIADPYGFLEGKGTKEGRRHLRLRSVSDIAEKHVEDYLELVWELF